MRKLQTAAAVVAVIVAIGKAIDCCEAVVTRVLMLTGMDYGRAAARAPLVCYIALSSIALVCLFAWKQAEDERDRCRRNPYGKIDRSHARSDEPDYRPNRRKDA